MNRLLSYVVLTIFASCVSASTGTFTMYSLPAFTSQRACAQNCFVYGNHDFPDDMGCPNPHLDSCVCRPDLVSDASSSIVSCVSKACSNTVDINSAGALYSSYCASVNGGPIAAVATTTDAAGNGGSKTVTITATVISSNGVVTTSPIPPITTIISQNDPNYANVIQIGNSQKGAAVPVERSILFSAAMAFGVLCTVMIL